MFSITALNNKLHTRPSLLKDQRGLTTVEYVIVLVLIAVGSIGLWTTFGKNIGDKIKDSNNDISTMEAEQKIK